MLLCMFSTYYPLYIHYVSTLDQIEVHIKLVHRTCTNYNVFLYRRAQFSNRNAYKTRLDKMDILNECKVSIGLVELEHCK